MCDIQCFSMETLQKTIVQLEKSTSKLNNKFVVVFWNFVIWQVTRSSSTIITSFCSTRSSNTSFFVYSLIDFFMLFKSYLQTGINEHFPTGIENKICYVPNKPEFDELMEVVRMKLGEVVYDRKFIDFFLLYFDTYGIFQHITV